MPSTAFNVHTEYVDSNETIKITFEDLNGHQDNEGYFVYLNGHRVICQESPEMLRDGSEMVASGLLCTVGLGTIMEISFRPKSPMSWMVKLRLSFPPLVAKQCSPFSLISLRSPPYGKVISIRQISNRSEMVLPTMLNTK